MCVSVEKDWRQIQVWSPEVPACLRFLFEAATEAAINIGLLTL